ncbi:tetratricopeptide repeat protein [Novosphingobium sp.]|uniref:tetratricopeptide repeat protein n=1 Tax=Novosphingobium sp. TaxID=1874826 RepID=UPI00262059A1|nr:tetratricopeptide repeat protein [Novosphingobium sp.]
MKIMIGSGRTGSAMVLALAAFSATLTPLGQHSAAQAQAASESTDVRLRRIEAELRAVQRKVFPDGAGKTFGPDITAPASGTIPPVPTPTAVTDLLTRMDAVEAQLQRLTAASEENQNHVAKLEARLAALEAAGSSAPTAGSTAAQQPLTNPAPSTPSPSAEAVTPPKPASKPTTTTKPDVVKAEASPDRVAAVMAIQKPSSDDKGEDEYTYGYRLWEAKFFPEAQQQLLRVVQQYPRHARISYARNLLGRAYLDDGKPGTAAQYFLQNYQADRKGDRAADSLLYLGVAMSRLKEEKRACVAFAEFRQTYPSELAGRLKSQYEAATKPVACN